ncbi:MAG: 16S rRNA (guanine(527)-N(7))-methyltransferase RsmG [Bacteroidales bacterium]|nr:16S rRNA (guanine(527)-N(7))-methyltransferase RsmG [Bacteroidales bacterium]
MQIIAKYFPDITAHQTQQFARLGELYALWNQRINVISRKDIENLYLHHVLHSLSIARVVSFSRGTTIVDAGTGGGFPGIPLAILFPDVHFTLVDSIAKKIKVVDAVRHEIGLDNVDTLNLRLEMLTSQADFVVCRAVTEIPTLFGWVKKNIRPGGVHSLENGLLALKGGDLSAELKPMGKDVQVFNLSNWFTEPFFETKKLVFIPLLPFK